MDRLSKLEQDVDEIWIRLSGASGGNDLALPPNLTPLSPPSTNFIPAPTTVVPSAVNQLRNGDLSHSVNTWFESVAAPAGDAGHECAYWFTNDAPVNGQVLSADNSLTNPGVDNTTLKFEGHPFYDPDFSDWDRANGYGRFQGTTTIDAPLPSNIAKPGQTEFLGAIVARRDIGYPDAVIVIPESCKAFAGVWDDTGGQLDWLHGTAFNLDATVRGAPASTTERRYKIYAKTDRGYSFLSTEVTVVDAPSDAAFLAGNTDVLLSWDGIPGILEYDIYRHDITDAKFRILESIGNGANQYADNGSVNIDNDAGGYPSATNTTAIAYVATNSGVLRRLVTVDGVAPFWPTLFLNIPVPSTYDQSVTTDAQWVRMGLTEALDRQMTDGVATMGDETLTTTTTTFSSQDVGRDIVVSDSDDNVLETSIDTVTSTTEIEMVDPWPFANADPVTVYVVEGGDHGLLVDLIHTSYVSRSAYAPNPEDLNRTLQPAATPNGSSQGGPGGAGGIDPGGGGVGCIALDTPVLTMIGEKYSAVPFEKLIKGDVLFSGFLQCNAVYELSTVQTNNLYVLRTENGIELECSAKHPVIRSRMDTEGLAVEKLRIGEHILTVVNGRLERTAVKEIFNTGLSARVGSPSLYPTNIYFAGKRYYSSPWERVKGWIKKKLTGQKDQRFIASHNRKPQENPVDNPI